MQRTWLVGIALISVGCGGGAGGSDSDGADLDSQGDASGAAVKQPGSTDPADPVDPVDPGDPANPVDPANPGNPDGPDTDDAAAKPSAPGNPTDPEPSDAATPAATPGSPAPGASPDASTARPDAPSTPSDSGPDAVDFPAAPDTGGEFIPWSAFGNEQLDEVLQAGHVRSATQFAGYDDDDLVIAVSQSDGNNALFALDVDGREARVLQFHVDCGDCLVGTRGFGVLLANHEGLWESVDGGYRFAHLGPWTVSEPTPVELLLGFGSNVWARVGSSWQTFTDKQLEATVATWPADAVSVGAGSALAVGDRTVNLYGDAAAVEDNPCSTLPTNSGPGTSWHQRQAVVISCGGSTIAATPELGRVPFTELQVDSRPLNVQVRHTEEVFAAIFIQDGEPQLADIDVVIATERSWLLLDPTSLALSPLAARPPAPEGEAVVAYLDDQGMRGLTISDAGIGLSPFPAAE